MRIFAAFAIFALIPSINECLAIEEIGVGDGLITVENNDGEAVDVLITDNDTCTVGLNSTVQSNTTRSFDIAEGAYLCIGERAHPVKDGEKYVIEGGALAPIQ